MLIGKKQHMSIGKENMGTSSSSFNLEDCWPKSSKTWDFTRKDMIISHLRRENRGANGQRPALAHSNHAPCGLRLANLYLQREAPVGSHVVTHVTQACSNRYVLYYH